jgi:hypothetical protein
LQHSHSTEQSATSFSGEQTVSTQVHWHRVNTVSNPVSGNVELVSENVSFLNHAKEAEEADAESNEAAEECSGTETSEQEEI